MEMACVSESEEGSMIERSKLTQGEVNADNTFG